MKILESTRVVIIGAGAVGSSSAYAILTQGICSELVLIDANKARAEGEALDLEHGLSFVRPAKVWAGEYADCATADIVVITAGIAQQPGQSRLELAATNAKIIEDIVGKVVAQTKDAVIMIVTNPVDVLTHVATKAAALPWGQVFGTGTALDSSRFQQLIGDYFHVAPQSVDALIIGEHGDSSLPIWSHAQIGGALLKSFPEYDEAGVKALYERAKTVVYDVIAKKGATNYAIGLGVSRYVRAILYNEGLVLPMSADLVGYLGHSDICLSVPCVIGRQGLVKQIALDLTEDERAAFQKSAETIRQSIVSLNA